MQLYRRVKPSKILLTVMSSITFVLALMLVLAVLSDSSGAPETGYVAVLAFVFIGSPLLICALITLSIFIAYKTAPDTQYQDPTIDQAKKSGKNNPNITVG